MAVILTRNERFYAQMETTFGIIPNTSGTATLTGSNCFQAKQMTLDPDQGMIVDPSKTGSRTRTPGVAGRRNASWSGDIPVRPNGVAGVKPDIDPHYQCLTGQAATINSGTASITGATNATPIVVTATNAFANDDVVTISGVLGNLGANGTFRLVGVSGSGFTLDGAVGTGAYASGGTASKVNVVYRLSDNIPSMNLWSFRKDAAGGVGMQQRVAIGAVVSKWVCHMNEDVASQQFNGEAVFIGDSKTVADSYADVTQQAGLTSFPAEPGSPTVNGGIVAGFTGRFTLNGVNQIKVNDATITVDTGNDLPKNYFGTYYPVAPEGDWRTVSLAFNIDDDSTAGTESLYEAAESCTTIDGWFQLGTIPGSIMVVVMKGIQLAMPKLNDTSSRRWQKTFAESMSHGSSLTALNEMAIWLC